MSPSIQDRSSQNSFDRSAGALKEEGSLRLIASLSAPEGLQDRVKEGLRSAPRQGTVIAWPFLSVDGRGWMQSAGMRAAAAAAIVVVIAGGGWEVYSHIQPASVPTAISMPEPLNGGGGFNSAGAKRVPQTLERPVVATPVIAEERVESGNSGAVAQKHAKRPAAKKRVPQAAPAR